MMQKPMLQTKGLSVSFGGLQALKDVDLEVQPGEIYGLIGPNGAGKTTVFNLLTGVYQPSGGSFALDGLELRGKSPRELSLLGIARTFQNIRLFHNLSVLENVLVGLGNQSPCSLAESLLRLPRHRRSERELEARARDLLEVFGLEGQWRAAAGSLPYGQQRKLEIARALATKPKLLLLDEPAAGMNPQETAQLMDTIRFVREHFGVTVLLIEHDMSLVSGICQRLTVLNFGCTLAQGPVAQVLRDPEVIRAYLGDSASA